jgi:hypothetical protein
MVGHSRASGWKVDGGRWGWEERVPDNENDKQHCNFVQHHRLYDKEEGGKQPGMMGMGG